MRADGAAAESGSLRVAERRSRQGYRYARQSMESATSELIPEYARMSSYIAIPRYRRSFSPFYKKAFDIFGKWHIFMRTVEFLNSNRGES
jgi:hypothetical protein